MPSPTKLRRELIRAVIAGARAHGEQSEPDMEVGDLQEAFKAAVEFMPPGKLSPLLAELEEIIEWGE